jgi:hypothetical protein
MVVLPSPATCRDEYSLVDKHVVHSALVPNTDYTIKSLSSSYWKLASVSPIITRRNETELCNNEK